jgi:hypothetical protein
MPVTATKLEISVIRKPAQAGVDVAEAALEWMAARRIRRWLGGTLGRVASTSKIAARQSP